MFCPVCKEAGVYYGRLRFPDDPPVIKCPHHPDVPLVESEPIVLDKENPKK